MVDDDNFRRGKNNGFLKLKIMKTFIEAKLKKVNENWQIKSGCKYFRISYVKAIFFNTSKKILKTE